MNKPPQMKFGQMELHIISDGEFSLDGGSMFGVVPKTLWKKLKPSDELNRIRLGLNSLLIKHFKKNIIIDTGIGTKIDKRDIELYDIRRKRSFIEQLKDLYLKPEDIDYVILTHLHLDHCGGCTYIDSNGILKPTFPNAIHIVQRKDWEDANNTNIRSRASYLKEDYLPIKEAGLLKFVNKREEIMPGISVERTGGHCDGHQIVFFESEGNKGVYLGDLIPTTAHLKPNWTMGWDLYPLEVINKKVILLDEAYCYNYLLIWEHEDEIPWGHIQKDEKGYSIIIS